MKRKNNLPAAIAFFIVAASQLCTQCNKTSNTVKDQTTKTTEVKNDSLAFGDLNWVSNGLVGKIYLLTENTPALPDFDTMKSVNTLYTQTINIPTRDWQSGFPGLANRFEWFAVVYKGNFSVKKTGHYTFRLVSDDGSKLFIDKKLVIDNDGQHPTTSRTGEIDLDNARHSITIQYFQGPRYQIALQLFATIDKGEEQIFPGNYFTLSTPVYNPLVIRIVVAILLIALIILIYLYWRKRRKEMIAAQNAEK